MANAGPNTNGSQFFIVTADGDALARRRPHRLRPRDRRRGRGRGARHHADRARRPPARAPAPELDPDRGGLTPNAAPSWEVTLLRRPPGARRPRVAARVVLEAPDLAGRPPRRRGGPRRAPPRRGPLDARDAAAAHPDGARHPPLPGDLRPLGGRRGPLRAHRRPPPARSGRPTPRAPAGWPSRRSSKVAGYEPAWRIRQVARRRRRPGARRGDPALSDRPPRRPLITGGGRIETAEWMEVRAPGDGELLAEVAAARPEDVDRAVRAADAAWPAWAALRPRAAGRALEAYAALIDAEQAGAGRAGPPRGGQAPRRGPGRGRPRGRGGPPLRRRGRAPLGGPAARAARSPPAAGSARRRSAWWPRSRPGTSPSRWWSGSWPRRWPPAARWWSSPPSEAPLAAWALCDLAERAGLPPGLVSCLTGDGPAARRGPGHPPAGRQGGLHRLAPGGRADRRLGRAAPEGALARARRPRPAGRAARRRPRRRRRGGRRSRATSTPARPATRSTGCWCRRRWPATCSSACARASPASRSGRWPPSAAWRATACCSRTPRADGARDRGRRGGRPRAPGPGPGHRRRAGRAAGRRGALHPDRGRDRDRPTSPPRSPRPTAPTTAWSATSAAPTCAARSRRPRPCTAGTVVVNGWRVVVPYAPYAGWRGSGVGAELGRPGLEAFVRWQHLRVLA